MTAVSQRLKANTIGPWGLAALAIGITSPAMGLYGQWGPMQVAAGPITPLIFLAAMLLTLPTAISYALLNRHAPSAGSASTWLWTSVSPSVGYLAGLAMTSYFLMATVAQPLIFTLFFRDFLQWVGLRPPELPALIFGLLISTIPVAWTALRGAEASIRTTVQLMIIETLVVLSLSATILVVKSSELGGINLSPFDPHFASGGLKGFWAAMILGVLGFCGFDVVSTAAEEAKAPREYLPKAILLTVIGITVFWALNAWAFTLSSSAEKVAEYTNQGLTAVTPVAQHYWGNGGLIVVLTAFTGITAVYISCLQGASRIAFALARHHLLPQKLGLLSGEKRIPRNAVIAVLLMTFMLDTLTLIILRSGLDSFVWWANALVFFATLTFLAVNVANMVHFWRLPGHQFGLIKNFMIPLIGIGLNAYLLYAAFFVSLGSGGWRTGKSVVLGCVTLLVVQILSIGWIRAKKPHLLSQSAPMAVHVKAA